MLNPVPEPSEHYLTIRTLLGKEPGEKHVTETRVIDHGEQGADPNWVFPLDGGVAFTFDSEEDMHRFEKGVATSYACDFDQERFERVRVVGTDIQCVLLRP